MDQKSRKSYHGHTSLKRPFFRHEVGNVCFGSCDLDKPSQLKNQPVMRRKVRSVETYDFCLRHRLKPEHARRFLANKVFCLGPGPPSP